MASKKLTPEYYKNKLSKDDWKYLEYKFRLNKKSILKSPVIYASAVTHLALSKGEFGGREEFNLEDAALIEHEELNMMDKQVLDLRKDLHIPELDHDRDYKIYLDDDYADCYHWTEWFDQQSDKVQKVVEQQITNWIEQYHLQENFRDWLHAYLISGRRPQWMPILNAALFFDVVTNPSKAIRDGLTTKEKDRLKGEAKRFFVERRRSFGADKEEYPETYDWSEQEGRKFYKHFLKILRAVPSLKRRPSKRFIADLGLLDVGKGVTYKDIASTTGVSKKQAGNATQRQQAKRVKERVNKIQKGPF